MVKICLVMVATNEAHRIMKLLQSVEPYISAVVQVISSDPDDTVTVMAPFLDKAGIPYRRHYHKMISGGDQRTFALHKAKDALDNGLLPPCDYLLMLDADNILEVTPGFNPFKDLTKPAYNIFKRCGSAVYSYICLFRSDCEWKYTGVIHEFPERVDGPLEWESLLQCQVIEEQKTNENRDLYRHYYDHALILERELLDNKDLSDMLRSRYIFYLANSYKDAGIHDRAIEYYRRRVPLKFWEEEIYVSLLYIGRLTGDTDEMMRAWNFRPQRLEAAYHLMQYYFGEGMINVAATIGLTTMQMQPCNDALFVEDIYADFVELFTKVQQTPRVL